MYKMILSGGKVGVCQNHISIKACSMAAKVYAWKYRLNAGTWQGGKIYEDGKYIGHVYHNGKILRCIS